MLSRIANNLFWLGRYMKRVEVCAKFIETEYIASLDAPLTYRKKSALSSILQFSGDGKNYKSWHPSLFDEAVLYHVTLDGDNPNSILSSMARARENAMSARDILPLNVWEAINTMYHKIATCSSGALKNQGAFEVLDKITIDSLMTQTLFDRGMIRDEVWQFIKLGVCLESMIQSCRVSLRKMEDINALDSGLKNSAGENYLWVTLLKSIGSPGIHKSSSGTESLKKAILNTVILDNRFPQSISYNLSLILDLAKRMEERRVKKDDSVIFAVGKLYGKYEYVKIEEILEEGIEKRLKNLLNSAFSLATTVEKRFF